VAKAAVGLGVSEGDGVRNGARENSNGKVWTDDVVKFKRRKSTSMEESNAVLNCE